jgi:hypothetical protein
VPLKGSHDVVGRVQKPDNVLEEEYIQALINLCGLEQ